MTHPTDKDARFYGPFSQHVRGCDRQRCMPLALFVLLLGWHILARTGFVVKLEVKPRQGLDSAALAP